MTRRERIQRSFLVTVYQDGDTPPSIRVEFIPSGLQQAVGPGGTPRQVPVFRVRTRLQGKQIVTDWETSPPEGYEVSPGDLEADATDRLRKRIKWLDLLSSLVDQVEHWANEREWATRRIRKELNDSEIGNYVSRALLLQEGTTRLLLEPIGRGSPGAEGVVDLYLLPAYDDVASLYYYDGRWHIHYLVPGTPVGNVQDTVGVVLSKAALQKALEALKQNAG